MAFTRLQDQKCGNCCHIDRETYRAAKVSVCYLIDQKDGNPVATTVTDKQDGCKRWRKE